MSAWPDAPILRAFLVRVSRRLAWLAAARGAAVGLLLAIVLPVAGAFTSSFERVVAGVAFAFAGALVAASAAQRLRRPVAYVVEQRTYGFRNLLITAGELIDEPARVRPWVGARVCQDAARIASGLDVAALFPARRSLAALLAAAALWAFAVTCVIAQPDVTPATPPAVIEAAQVTGIDFAITPPAYAGGTAQTLNDPTRIEALAGSRIALTVHALATAVTMESTAGRQTLAADRTGVFAGEIIAEQDGYIALNAAATEGGRSARRLIGLTVRPDESPRVRVTVPGSDLFLPDAERTIDVQLEGNDDLGLASLRLRYTRVSGSGEQFTFRDGELPLAIVRENDRTWTGRAAFRLDTLALEPGDVLVYRGFAADHRPGAIATESDPFVIEITAPGEVAAEGFAMDDEEDRYAISQQMVILKTEQLIARAAGMASDSLVREARSLAAEQRTVRAEFVFMMGGELAEEVEAAANLGALNEEDHVEADDEAIAGRLENQGRNALIRAIRSMSRAYAALNEADLDNALVEEKAALAHLQNAFSRTRYILRALTEREQIDLARRLTGELSTAARQVRPVAEPVLRARDVALRNTLSGVMEIAAGRVSGLDAAAQATRLAEEVLRTDPSAQSHQRIADLLINAAVALNAGRDVAAWPLLERAATDLAAIVRSSLPVAPGVARPLDVDLLDGALADLLRAGER